MKESTDLERRNGSDVAAVVLVDVADERRFGYGRQCHFPVVVRIVGYGADVADDEAANLVGCQDETRQDEDDLVGHGVNDALAHPPRFNFQAHAQFDGGVHDLVRRFARIHVMLQQSDSLKINNFLMIFF